jgi:hypothetical protein
MTTSSNLLNKVLVWIMRRAQDELVQLNGPSPASVDIYRMDIPYRHRQVGGGSGCLRGAGRV